MDAVSRKLGPGPPRPLSSSTDGVNREGRRCCRPRGLEVRLSMDQAATRWGLNPGSATCSCVMLGKLLGLSGPPQSPHL